MAGLRLALLLLTPLCTGCLGDPVAVDPGPVVTAFRSTLETHYEERRLRAEGGWTRRTPPKVIAAARVQAGTRLIDALKAAGRDVHEAEARRGLRGLVPHVERFLHTRTDLAFGQVGPPARGGSALDANADPGSFLIADEVEHAQNQTLRAAGLELGYDLVRFGRLLTAPYEVWLGERRGRPEGGAAWAAGDVVYLDLGRLERSADGLLYDRADDLRAALDLVTGEEALLRERLPEERLAALKDALRWRALRPLWEATHALEQDERRRRFAEVRGRELIEAVVLARHFEGPSPGVGPAARTRTLLATLDGTSPLGALATILGLHLGGDAAATAALTEIARRLGLPPDRPLGDALVPALATISEADVRALAAD